MNSKFTLLNSTETTDWKYEMRREMQQIIPGLFLGPYSVTKDLNYLKNHAITHILCLRDTQEEHIIKQLFPDQFIYRIINVSDSLDENLIPHFPHSKEFIDSCLINGGKVLVHCNGGISRSPSFIVAYLMENYSIDYSKAYSFVQNKRFCINPNDGFKYQLKEYEPIFQARKEMINYPTNEHSQKRQYSNVDNDL